MAKSITITITITIPTLIRSLAMSSAISCKNLLEGKCDFGWHLCSLLNQYFHYEPVQQILIWLHCIENHYLFYAIIITTKHLSLPEWSIGLLALPLLFLTVFSRSTVIVKLKVLDTAEAQDRFLLPPRKVCGTILELLCVSFFFLQIIQSDFFLARLDTCLQFVQPCMRS